MGRAALRLYTALIYAFLFLPLVVITLFAFHDGDDPTRWPPRLGTLRWFAALAQDEDLIEAVQNSLLVGVIAVAVAGVLGCAAALAIHRYRFRGAALFYGATMLPALVPGLVLGIAMLILFSAFKVELSLWTVVVGHIAFLTPVILTGVLTRLERLPPSYEQASRDLGASAWQTFWLVTLPNIRTALVGALLFAFTLSFDNIVLTFFLTGFDKTLPLEFWGRLRFGLTPATNAVATLMALASLLLVFVANRLMRQE